MHNFEGTPNPATTHEREPQNESELQMELMAEYFERQKNLDPHNFSAEEGNEAGHMWTALSENGNSMAAAFREVAKSKETLSEKLTITLDEVIQAYEHSN